MTSKNFELTAKEAEKVHSSQTLKTVLFSLWLLLVTGVIIAIANQDKFFAVELKPIALLASRSGSVLARSEGLVRWRETVEHQGIYDGDRLATGADSKSVVRFDAKRTLELGEDTQVQITAIQQGDGGLALMVTLFRGSMLAETDGSCSDCPPLVLRDAGGETYNVSMGKKVALVKAVGKKAKTFDPKVSWPVTPKAERPKPLIGADFVKIVKFDDAPDEQELARLKLIADEKAEREKQEQERAAKEKAEREKRAQEKQERERQEREAVAKGFEAIFSPSIDGKVYWTMEPLAELSKESLSISVAPPAQKPEASIWRAAIELSGKQGTPIVLEAASTDETTFKIPIDKLRPLASTRRSSGIGEYTVGLRSGAVVTKQSSKQTSFGSLRSEVRIRSLGEPVAGPVTVALDQLKTSSDTAIWMNSKESLPLKSAALAISLTSGADYGKLAPFIRGAGAVGISHEAIGNDGVFIVREHNIVAQLHGALAQEKTTVSTILRTLTADFAFKGPKSALYDSRGKSQTALVDWLGALLDKGNVLYVLKKKKLYSVSRDFIKTNNEVAQFVDTQARAIFLEKVEIIDYR